MKLSLLIATIDAGIFKLEAGLPGPCPGVTYLVSHQVTGEQYRVIPEGLKRTDVQISVIEGRGLARNRNNALALVEGDLALLADDDACYRPGYFRTVINTFKGRADLDVACFKIATPPGEPLYKDYGAEPFCLNDESRHYVSSLEIAFRVARVREKGICFDQRFGLGSALISSGEEAVFIFDCIRAGLRVCYIPEYVVEHARESTTKDLAEYSTERTLFKGAYDARRYGWKALPAALIDAVRLRRRLRGSGKSPVLYLSERLRGAGLILRGQARQPGAGL